MRKCFFLNNGVVCSIDNQVQSDKIETILYGSPRSMRIYVFCGFTVVVFVGESGSVAMNSEMVMKMQCRWFRDKRCSEINVLKIYSTLKHTCTVVF